jgi:hypothetical protein
MKRNLLVVLALIGCGPGSRNGDGDDDNTPDSNGGGGGDGGNSGDGCSDASKLVYVVDENNKLSTFNPPTKVFADLGTLNCPAQFLATPFSMGIDRNATAWVLYSSGELFRVDTANNLACTKSSWQPGRGGHQVFGMGFSTDTAGGTTDTLFIAGGQGPTVPTSMLARLDMTTFQPATVGNVTGWPELTGTGSAELWGFFPATTGTRVDQINKTTGMAARSFQLPTLNGMPTAWAFAFHGGDFWIFLANPSTGDRTTVFQMNGMTGAIAGMTSTNRKIVGAGVSTCAPVVIF